MSDEFTRCRCRGCGNHGSGSCDEMAEVKAGPILCEMCSDWTRKKTKYWTTVSMKGGDEIPGTVWTKPGEGSTFEAIRQAVIRYYGEIRTTDIPNMAGRLAPSDRTNLKLTGAPLTRGDLKRIAEAK